MKTLKKKLTLLGSTGSIGRQTLQIINDLDYEIFGLTANSNAALLAEQAREFNPRCVAISDNSCYNELKLLLADTSISITAGAQAVEELAAVNTGMVLNAIVGIAGLKSSLAALKAGNQLSLANKESLVAAGELVINTAREAKANIIPVDSEHSAIFQCLNGENCDKIKRVLLTASGGPFFGYTREMLEKITVEDALKHPNWSMGSKITIDSATMMNKGLEFIEAMFLFSLTAEQIEVLVHRQSIVHSAVEFVDNAIIAQMGAPDMKIPIAYALTYPDRRSINSQPVSLFDIEKLTFERPDTVNFPCLATAIKAAKIGGLAPCAVNSANEEAVSLFLNKKISFNDIGDIVNGALSQKIKQGRYNLDDVIETDINSREYVRDLAGH